MGVIATAVKHLMAAGVTGEALVLAITEMETERPVDRAAENRRAYDRERKRADRQADKSGGCPVESADSADKSTLDKKTPQTPKRINPESTPPIVPPWVPTDEWASFEEMRRRIRKPMTDRARELAVSELAKLREQGHEPAVILNWAVLNSYQGLFPPPKANRARAGPEPVIGI